MDRMKFEGRMNYFMLTAIRSAKNEDGLRFESYRTAEGTFWLCGRVKLRS